MEQGLPETNFIPALPNVFATSSKETGPYDPRVDRRR